MPRRAIGLAILFDSLDGRVARMTGTNTDLACSSIRSPTSSALASLLPYWLTLGAFRSVQPTAAINVEQLRTIWLDFLPGIFDLLRVAFGALQCAGMAPGSSKFFVGMPTPAAAGVIASIVHCFSGSAA